MSNDLVTNKSYGEHDSLSDHASAVFEESSVCPVSTILLTESRPRKIFRSVVFVLFTVAFFYQCIAFLYYVLQYPTIVDHETFRPERFVSPAYTFCNYNPVKRSKFCAKYPNNCTKPDKEFCFENPRFCGTPDTRILKDDIYDLDDLQELYQFRHEAEDMVDFNDKDDHKPVGPLPRANQNEGGVAACFSYFGRVNSPLDPYMKNRTPIAIGDREMFSFDPQENELVYPETKSGMMFDVHTPFVGSNPFDTGFFMKPGYLYRVTVKITQEELLPYECLNYTEIWLKNNKTDYRSQEACREKCIGDVIVKCYNCTEPIVLYPYPNENFCRHGRDPPDLSSECKKADDAAIECMDECKDDCLKTTYSYEVQENFLNRYAYWKEKNESRSIRVIIEFPGRDIQKIVHKPQFQVLEVFSLIGGLLAFWIGLSMFQVVEVFDSIFQVGKYFCKKRSAKSEISSA